MSLGACLTALCCFPEMARVLAHVAVFVLSAGTSHRTQHYTVSAHPDLCVGAVMVCEAACGVPCVCTCTLTDYTCSVTGLTDIPACVDPAVASLYATTYNQISFRFTFTSFSIDLLIFIFVLTLRKSLRDSKARLTARLCTHTRVHLSDCAWLIGLFGSNLGFSSFASIPVSSLLNYPALTYLYVRLHGFYMHERVYICTARVRHF